MDEFWGKPISVYTRAQALADGVLVDLTESAKPYGFKIPLACTDTVWRTLDWPVGHKPGLGQSTAGRVHDVLTLARMGANGAAQAGLSVVAFDALLVPVDGEGTKARSVHFRLVVSGGDHGEPVLTLLFPGEE